ncbi:hypothetical protein HNQ80_000114 [Anaerosolibacter carboniphilus]|uniref:Uncharacterized protein n=1 Tax=Anaerosolibacter carboniphilus TaxID=1417629 RepID=A0A841KV41_9FIRM|nr:hypothetical protein [Anaerosolibacter carboniphilus]MBB6214045.1 hypothetical protein [Anaerosolibacter carboniphilus]
MKKINPSLITLALAFMLVGGGVTNAFTPIETKNLVYDRETLFKAHMPSYSRQC